MKIKNLSIVCEAMGNLINACMDANITTDEIRQLSEMDNEFALCVNNISKIFTIDIKDHDTSQEVHNNNNNKSTDSKDTIENTKRSDDDGITKLHILNDHQYVVDFIKKNKSLCETNPEEAFNKCIKSDKRIKFNLRTFYEILNECGINNITQSISNDTDEFVDSPIDGVLVNKRGEILCKYKNGETKSPNFRVNNNIKSFSYNGKHCYVARIVLSTFCRIGTTGDVPIYKDGNHMNCSLDNLTWGSHGELCVVIPEKIESICNIIKNYISFANDCDVTQSDNNIIYIKDIVKECICNNINTTRTLVTSIIMGKYRNISDKYFDSDKMEKLDASRIKYNNHQTSTEEQSDLSSIIKDNNGDILSLFNMTKNLEYGKQLFKQKMKMKMKISQYDQIIPILYCLRNADNVVQKPMNIIKDIRNVFGKVFITRDFVYQVLNKKFLPEITDSWFSLSEVKSV